LTSSIQARAGRLPAELTLSYRLEAQFASPSVQADPPPTVSVTLPITTPPSQVAKLVSAGIALSPYVRSPITPEPDRAAARFGIEFDTPVQNPRDTNFARLLALAPDPVLFGAPVDLSTRPSRRCPSIPSRFGSSFPASPMTAQA
jgi:hypothetical protein